MEPVPRSSPLNPPGVECIAENGGGAGVRLKKGVRSNTNSGVLPGR